MPDSNTRHRPLGMHERAFTPALWIHKDAVWKPACSAVIGIANDAESS